MKKYELIIISIIIFHRFVFSHFDHQKTENRLRSIPCFASGLQGGGEGRALHDNLQSAFSSTRPLKLQTSRYRV